MNEKQFSDRIGNVNDNLVQQAEQTPNYGREHRKRSIRQLVAIAATIALMACSFTVGAFAFAKETIVEVPVKQEIIEIEEIGLSLILPDSWRGKYDVTKAESGSYVIFNPQIKEAWGGGTDPFDGGVLFYIVRIDEVLTADQIADSEWNFAANRYLFTTQDSTYLLYYASDVQFTPETMEEYQQMESEISNIRFVVDNALN